MTKIAICGETYSANLGDGVIAESLAWLLKESDPGVSVSFIDFSGANGFSTENLADNKRENWIRTIHLSLARFSLYRRGVILPIWYWIKGNRLRQWWREKINDCDLVLIGGGQLLMDNDLVFPLKVWEIVRIAHDLDKIVTFYACGVGKKWSRLGLHLLARALFDENVMGVSVRDNGSRDILRALFPNAKFAIDLAIDPAVCAAEAYKINADPDSNIIGLNISAPHVLKKRVSGTKSTFAVKRFRQFWLDLAEILTCDHRQFVLFTNGQVEDYAFAQHIAAEIYSKKKMKQVYLLKRPLDPRILTSQIAQFRAIVAHRLHANIIAYSMGIPSVGLIWDKKVEEFGKMTERSNFYLDPTHMDPWIVKQCLYDAMSVGVDPLRLAYNKAFALRSVHTMLSLTGIKPNRRFLDL